MTHVSGALPTPTAPAAGPTTAPSLLADAAASDPGRPRLTWYGADGDRVELSARVLANWVAKTANLLVEELLDPADPSRSAAGHERPLVLLDLPVHWRSVVWGLAAWAVGADLDGASELAGASGPDGARRPDVVVTADAARAPATDPAGAPLVVLSLAALALRAEGVPPGAIDYNAVVAGFGDQLPAEPDPLPLDGLLAGAAWAERTAPPRLLLEVEGTPLLDALRAVARVLAVDGSVVLRGPGAPDAAHLASVEITTA